MIPIKFLYSKNALKSLKFFTDISTSPSMEHGRLDQVLYAYNCQKEAQLFMNDFSH